MEMRSERGCPKFEHEGYIYIFDKMSVNGVTKFWRCEQKLRCKARIHTRGEVVIKSLNMHSHDSDPARILVRKAVSEMKRRAAETVEGTSQVINEALQDLPECVMGVMPAQSALKKTIKRLRRQQEHAPVAPLSLEDLVIPEEYKLYWSTSGTSEDFLLADSGPSTERILIFGRKRSVENLKDSRTWFVDGTFSIAPTLFRQVYVILAEKYGGVHTLFYALLPNKSEATYTRMFALIKKLTAALTRNSFIATLSWLQ